MVAPRDGFKGQAGRVVDYGPYAAGVRVASFAEGRIGYREWTRRSGRLGDMHSIDNRYDHDVDELMV
jgi:hypothetical protein